MSLKNIILLVLFGALILFGYLYFRGLSEQKRLRGNQSSLLDSVARYRVRDSLSGVSIGTLTLKLSEVESYRASDKKLIEDMGVRLRRVENYSRVSLSSSYTIEALIVDTIDYWRYKTQWIDLSARKQSDTLRAEVVVYDTIVQVLHRVPRFKFLGIWFGTKSVRQEIVSKNPYTNISAAEYIEIVR